ncbi:MAG: primosomal protein N' [Candidatus Izemoplasmataceae bacterium]
MIAQVIVDVKHKNVDQMYDYLVPDHLVPFVMLGQRVKVPFGYRYILGFVVGFVEDSAFDKLKSISEIIDVNPVLSEELLYVANKMTDKTHALKIAMLMTMLPAALKASYQKRFIVKNKQAISDELKHLIEDQSGVLDNQMFRKHHHELKTLIDAGDVLVENVIKQKIKKKRKMMYHFSRKPEKLRGQKQRIAMEFLEHQKSVFADELYLATGVSRSTMRTLVDKGYVSESEEEVYRDIKSIYQPFHKEVKFTKEQEYAYQEIKKGYGTKQCYLLHGVTGSGKTELYLNIIEDVISVGKQAIMLVPEISLTPQMIRRVKGRFPENVALYHSGLSQAEKYDEWRKMKRKEVQVVVGARSAIFAPFEELGVIIIDEEHTESYKQTDHPKYHAIDVAALRSEYHKIPVILGSATPSVESYYKASLGQYQLLELKNRPNRQVMPVVEIVDMKEEFKSGNRSVFSRKLKTLIKDRLAKNEQIIILLNRRGHSSFVICRNCGEVIMCPNCDISLTYHEQSSKLKCHYCGHDEENPTVCPKCQSKHIRYMGIGTEKVELLLNDEFPEARIIRMDGDTTTKKNAHETLLHTFEHKGDILLGTQMIAKGLDFDRVTLVGVLAADMSLSLPDYEATEHTFQLLTQVAGRAGRRETLGDVVIQTYQSDHYAILAAKNHDYDSFYHQELEIRKQSGYKPIQKVVQIVLHDDSIKNVLKIGQRMVISLRKELSRDIVVLGPVLPKVSRINNQYRAQILIKGETEEHDLYVALNKIYKQYGDELMIEIDDRPSLL